MPKNDIFEKKNLSLTILLSSLGLHLSLLLVRCAKIWFANLLTTILTKKNEQFNVYMFNVIYM